MRVNAKWLPALVAPAALVLGIAVAQPGTAATQSVTQSPYVAGYAAVTKSGGAVTSFIYVQATFTVPALNCTSAANGGGVFHAVFLADRTANPWLNTSRVGGVQELCQSGSPSYAAINIDYCNSSAPEMAVSQGDTVQVTVSPDAVAIYDRTTNTSLQNSSGPSCGTSAVAGVVTAEEGRVANFTQIGFRQIQVQGSGMSLPRPLASSGWN